MNDAVPPPGIDESLVEYEREQTHAVPPVSPWVHFVAGGIAGMAGAVVTSPLDVIKTRMQSDMIAKPASRGAAIGTAGTKNRLGVTMGVIADIYRTEGWRALFRGLGPNLAGVVPARAVNFFTYGVSKQFYASILHDRAGTMPATHLLSGMSAGFVTSAVTNPIWLVKTRMQLDRAPKSSSVPRQYKNSFDCLIKVVRYEGVSALYRGLSASLIGSSETSIQWVLYEQMRHFIHARQLELSGRGKLTSYDKFVNWSATSGAAGLAKLIASLIAYPHEVVRTRLRQAPLENGNLKYRGLVNCFRKVYLEEGLAALYGGLTPHLLRTVPNSIIMFGTWDLIVRFISDR